MKQKTLYLLAIIITISSCRKTETASPPPTIAGFDPQKLAAFNYITIQGSHFDTSAIKNSVSFNGQAATVFRVQGDSVLIVVVPQNVTAGKITVTANGVTATSANSYSVLPGGWIRRADLPDPAPPNGRADGIGFAIGNTGYIGLGANGLVTLNDLYAYDPATDKWTARSPMPIKLSQAFCMVINGKAYVGTGYAGNSSYTKQFFEYDPTTDKWTAKADFPTVRYGTSAYSAGDKGYAGFGVHEASYYKDWWQYDPATDSWTPRADFPGSFIPSAENGFVLNNKIYVGGTASVNPTINEWWQYDIANDSWTQLSDLPWGNNYLKGVTINNKGYLMGPENWLYDDVHDKWTQKAFLGPRSTGSVFSIGNKAYYGTGFGLPSKFFNNDFWEYTPN
jgi:N-acetylneuraminic acid mutarotase